MLIFLDILDMDSAEPTQFCQYQTNNPQGNNLPGQTPPKFIFNYVYVCKLLISIRLYKVVELISILQNQHSTWGIYYIN